MRRKKKEIQATQPASPSLVSQENIRIVIRMLPFVGRLKPPPFESPGVKVVWELLRNQTTEHWREVLDIVPATEAGRGWVQTIDAYHRFPPFRHAGHRHALAFGSFAWREVWPVLSARWPKVPDLVIRLHALGTAWSNQWGQEWHPCVALNAKGVIHEWAGSTLIVTDFLILKAALA